MLFDVAIELVDKKSNGRYKPIYRTGCGRVSNSVGREDSGERSEKDFPEVDLDSTGCGWPSC